MLDYTVHLREMYWKTLKSLPSKKKSSAKVPTEFKVAMETGLRPILASKHACLTLFQFTFAHTVVHIFLCKDRPDIIIMADWTNPHYVSKG